MSFSIAGKSAIVTGAANGVGLAIARHFAAHGANVMCADMDEAQLIEEFGTGPEGEDGADERIKYFAGDLREKLTIANLLSATLDHFERVDILVNAARQVTTTDPLDMADASVETMLDQNLLSSLRLSQLVARRMIQQGDESDSEDSPPRGTIVNLSSIAAVRTRPELLGYSVASAALDQMTRSLAVALAPQRIRVNAVAFGSVRSASLRQALKARPDLREAVLAATPAGRVADADEVAGAVRFLASQEAGFMTGQIVTVDGGRSLLDPVAAVAH